MPSFLVRHAAAKKSVASASVRASCVVDPARRGDDAGGDEERERDVGVRGQQLPAHRGRGDERDEERPEQPRLHPVAQQAVQRGDPGDREEQELQVDEPRVEGSPSRATRRLRATARAAGSRGAPARPPAAAKSAGSAQPSRNSALPFMPQIAQPS